MPCIKPIIIAILAMNIASIYAETTSVQPGTIDNISATHVAGLPEIKPNVKGSLAFTAEELTFSNSEVHSSIPLNRISNVFAGDERTEPWGTTGRIVRKVIPYGGGSALGAMTNQKVDLLTVEFRDIHEGYHGVVFIVPKQKAAEIRDRLMPKTPISEPHPLQACSALDTNARSVLVEPLTESQIELPAEYRVLIYEQLIKQLKAKRPSDTFFRTGDLSTGPGCTALTLRVTVTAFKKGNRAVRASTGPLGLFLGTTSLTFDVSLQDTQEKNVFHKQIKKSNRSDSDSLGLADAIAKGVAKQFDKSLNKSATQTASLN
ncbi:DUF4410 domain-containing protein [Acidicapsa ligni]|uniref:DUF4410 domain-containing protein n=1 Tax=Acidicapsa ligni TaxID=542300 RepID=UPI0021E086AB|nr:DUF4410 domain-containing protein [Acidicapsa ligni]